MKNSVKDEILHFFESQEGMNFIASSGKLFAAGAMSVMKINPRQQNMNIFGMKIPTAVVMAVLEKSGMLKKATNIMTESLEGGLKLG